MLFGGGLTLAAAIEGPNGVSEFIGNSSRGLAGLPRWCCCSRSPP